MDKEEITPYLVYYSQIMDTETRDQVMDLEAAVSSAVLTREITDEREISILKLALMVRSQQLLLDEIMEHGLGGTTIMIVGDPDMYDPEQMQLDQLREHEAEDFKDGNVVPFSDFKKKK